VSVAGTEDDSQVTSRHTNCAATRVNLLKTREKCVRRKTVFCRDFASSRNL
jgi:hypothetical protein